MILRAEAQFKSVFWKTGAALRNETLNRQRKDENKMRRDFSKDYKVLKSHAFVAEEGKVGDTNRPRVVDSSS